MYSEEEILKLIKPILDRQEAINIFVIRTIAKRIKEIGKLTTSDALKLEAVMRTGADVRMISREIARLTNLQVIDIKHLIRDIAYNAYIDLKPYYDYRHKAFIPFQKNEPLQKVVTAIANRTAGEYVNMANSKAIGFMIRDLKHPGRLKFQSIGQTYNTVIDEAIQMVQGGVIDYNTAMRRTMKQLADSGIRKITYESGYTQRLDTAVRRNISDGVRAINQGVQDETGKQFGATGKEISVHINSAPDHEPIQGRQFTNEEVEKMQNNLPFQDVNGKQYPAMKRAIGMWNCRHYMWSIIVGFSQPMYTEKQLQEMAERNAKGYTLPDGKHLSMYECEQYQRKLETKIRQAKEGQIMAKEQDDMDEARRYQGLVNKYTQQYKQFSEGCGLPVRQDNLTVSGYKKISMKK